MKNSTKFMFVFGVIAFAVIMIVVNQTDVKMDSANFWFYRVLTALAASAISISIPGMLSINYHQDGAQTLSMEEEKSGKKPMTLAEKEPTITASGAIAVFVLVYMFNPIG